MYGVEIAEPFDFSLKTLYDAPKFEGEICTRGRKNSKKRNTLIQRWVKAFGNACSSCGCEMKLENDPTTLDQSDDLATLDHILARGLGGSNLLSNITVMCKKCNHEKSQIESGFASLLLRSRDECNKEIAPS